MAVTDLTKLAAVMSRGGWSALPIGLSGGRARRSAGALLASVALRYLSACLAVCSAGHSGGEGALRRAAGGRCRGGQDRHDAPDRPAVSGGAGIGRGAWLPIAAALGLAAPAAAGPLHAALGAPDTLLIAGTSRLRLETIDGQFRPFFASSDTMVSLRTTLAVEYRPGPLFVGAEIMDSRAYLQSPRSSAGTGEVNALELTQAYVGVALSDPWGGGKARLLAGRFTLDLGGRRLVARNAFRNTTNAFTGVLFDWHGRGADQLLAFWSMPHIRLPRDPEAIRANRVVFDRATPDLQLMGLSGTHDGVLGGSLQLYVFGLLERDAPGFPTADRRLFVPGIRLFAPPRAGQFDHDIEFAWQMGTTRATALPGDVDDLDVTAWLLHAEIGHTFAAPLRPRLAIGYDHATGDGANPRTFNRFDTLFGARRLDYGPSGLFGPVTRSNLIAPVVRAEVAPGMRFDAMFDWRPLWLASRTDAFAATLVRDPAGQSGRFAGHQLELRARYWLVPGVVRIDSGVAALLRRGFLRAAPLSPGGGDTHYGYLDVNVTF
jgi:hypothetical protein